MKTIFLIILSALIAGAFAYCRDTKNNKTNNHSANSTNGTNIPPKGDSLLVETDWRLAEVMGKAMTPASGEEKEIYMRLKRDGNQVEGFGGCNGFGGTYEIGNNFKLIFDPITSTMMACPNLETENAFFNVLKTVDNYYISGDTLLLNKAKMATMARLVRAIPTPKPA